MPHHYSFHTRLLKLLGIALLVLSSCANAQSKISISSLVPFIHREIINPAPRVALVLGGGGARSYAHIGVINVLSKEDIPIDLIVGTSGGSIVGALYADNPSARHLKAIAMQSGRGDILDISALHPLEGPITGSALQTFLTQHMHAHYFDQLRIPFIAVATNLKTGNSVPMSSGLIATAVNASSALPPFFRPVQWHGHTLVDGGATDPVPVDIASQFHPEIIIAVSVVQDLPHDMPTNAVGIYDRSYMISDLRFNNFSTHGADVVIHPDVGQTGVFDDSHKRALIKAGELATKKALPMICAALAKDHIHSKCS